MFVLVFICYLRENRVVSKGIASKPNTELLSYSDMREITFGKNIESFTYSWLFSMLFFENNKYFHMLPRFPDACFYSIIRNSEKKCLHRSENILAKTQW